MVPGFKITLLNMLLNLLLCISLPAISFAKTSETSLAISCNPAWNPDVGYIFRMTEPLDRQYIGTIASASVMSAFIYDVGPYKVEAQHIAGKCTIHINRIKTDNSKEFESIINLTIRNIVPGDDNQGKLEAKIYEDKKRIANHKQLNCNISRSLYIDLCELSEDETPSYSSSLMNNISFTHSAK